MDQSFGHWLKQRRRALDLTQEQLASQLGCAVTTIRKFEAHVRRPSSAMLDRLLDVLKVPQLERRALVCLAREQATNTLLTTPNTGQKEPSGTSLPSPITSFIGRRDQVKALQKRLRQGEVRLLTLVGPPGVGKTRLALQAADEMSDDFVDGVHFVDLSSIFEPALVLRTVAQTLHVRGGGCPLHESLKNYLRHKSLLLVLDNFEQVLTGAVEVTNLLAAAGRLKILVTSREPLHLYGEHQIVVPPLTLPDLDRLPSVDSLSRYEAVALFVQRAQMIQPDFGLTAQNAADVAYVCAQLDGLPLAIELAASRINLFSPAALQEQLTNPLNLLTLGPPNLPRRHQTLREAIGWSEKLLAIEERIVFRRLSVFVGSFAVEAARYVCDVDSDLEGNVSTILSSLANKNLLQRVQQPDGRLRYRMLKTIRQYALEQLQESGEADNIRHHHVHFFLNLAETAEPFLSGGDRGPWLERLNVECDNLRAALMTSQVCGSSDLKGESVGAALRLAASLPWFWYFQQLYDEGRYWLERVLIVSEPLGNTHVRAKVLWGAGFLAFVQSDYDIAYERLELAARISQREKDQRGQALALTTMSTLKWYQGDLQLARALSEQSAAIAQEVGDTWLLALTYYGLGIVLLANGRLTEATGVLEDSLQMFRELRDTWGIALLSYSLGGVAQYGGELVEARIRFEESIGLFRELGDKYLLAYALASLATVMRWQGDAKACAFYEESLHLRQELGDREGITQCLQGVGMLMCGQQKIKQAVRLLGAAEGLRQAIGAVLPAIEHSDYEQSLNAAHAQLNETEFTSAWAEGQAMTADQAIEYAMGQLGHCSIE